MFGLFFSPYDLFVIPGLFLGIYAQFKLSAAYNHYVQVGAASGVTGAQAAREILDDAGLAGMPVQEVPGHLTDHYDPTKKALFLSSENYNGRSIAALGVAAHEAGHALQHKSAYAPLQWRMAIVPATGFASSGAFLIIIGGMLLSSFQIISGALFAKLLAVAIGLFAVVTLFQIITLPVEYDASRRAKEQLLRLGLIQRQEHSAVSKVLNAAAMTYVAAMVTSMLELLKWVMIARSVDRD